MTTKEMIGLRIRNRIIELGMSQYELAQKLGYASRRTLKLLIFPYNVNIVLDKC